METKQKIAEIIQERGKVLAQVDASREQWKARSTKGKTLKMQIIELRSVCQRAMSGVPEENRTAFRELAACLDEIEQKRLPKLLSDCSFASEQLEKLNQRFNRKTINIAVAGVGRCGKSTALKAIIGQSQDDNSTIPSGRGPAITAGKSTICCVMTAEEEKTVVQYHTIESFLADLVNPLLQSIGLSVYKCADAGDFTALDYDTLHNALEQKAQQFANGVSSQQDLTEAYPASINLYYERLNHLHEIMKAFPFFLNSLNGGKETVSLDQTYRYVSYPKSGEPAICYAVKECRIYSRFPNNEVNALELTDLPGLGTSSQSEKKCFLDGFNYSVDLALMIRRPEGLFQNFTTEPDLSVMNVLGATFGADHLHECMLLFQNDANLPESDVERSYDCIQKWNSLQKHPLSLIRGDASDSVFMQKTLLPEVLSFIANSLPMLDKALIERDLTPLTASGKDFDSTFDAIVQDLSRFKRGFPSSRGANAINEKVKKVRNLLRNRTEDLKNWYGYSFEEQNTLVADTIEDLTVKAKEWVKTQYDPHNPQRIEEAIDSIREYEAAASYATDSIHAIRIHISEIFSELEKIHDSLIAEMQNSVAGILRECFPKLLSENAGLDDFFKLAEQFGECPEFMDAVRTLNTLEVPFYNMIYPDLRKQVFGSSSMEDLLKNFFFENPDEKEEKTDPKEKEKQRAVNTLSELQNIGINWIWRSGDVLYSQSRITEVISAALERFQDRMTRNDNTRCEMVGFIEHFWGDIQNDDNSYREDIRTKLDNIANAK